MKRVFRSAAIISVFMLTLGACASKPYTTKQTIDKQTGTRVDTVCTHKTYVIPWYAVVAAGFFTIKGGQKCVDQVKEINALTVEQENKIKEDAEPKDTKPVSGAM